MNDPDQYQEIWASGPDACLQLRIAAATIGATAISGSSLTAHERKRALAAATEAAEQYLRTGRFE